MRLYFVDTWFLIALVDRFDRHHAAALRVDRLTAGSLLVTHEGVLAAFLTYFGEQGAHRRAAAAGRARHLLMHPQYTVEPFSRYFDAALSLYERRPDKGYSLTDCMSMALMRDRGITDVLTNDHHFRQEGFTVVGE
jgi:predicted nucleic acid-binding protein